MKIAILGSGAMGCLVGAFLKKGGEEVHLIDTNRAHMEAIRENGLSLEVESIPGEPGYSEIVSFDSAGCDASAVGECDAVIVLVKCFVTHDAIKANGALFGRDTIVITLQNGLGTQELLREHFDDKSIGYGLMKASALQFAPGKIYGRPHFAESPRGIYYRPIDLNSPYYAKFAEIGEALNRGGLPAELAEGIDEIIWSKLYNNCLFNGIGALLQLPNEISSNHPDGLALMEHIGREVCTVAQAKGFDMDPDTFWREHGGRVILPEGGKLHFTSAVLDAYKKNQTEIDFMNGAVVCEGKKLGIECPYNETIWRLVHIMQSTYNDRYIPE